MRVTIDIDDKLMAEAVAATGLSTQKATGPRANFRQYAVLGRQSFVRHRETFFGKRVNLNRRCDFG